VRLNLEALPERPADRGHGAADDGLFAEAARQIAEAERIVIKAGGGTRGHDRPCGVWPKPPELPS
jgi:3D-(3,5/4)-trihydroxycyclohexane-1,2-dione acylhydrolase (decyclizing)